jgi:hypothetical protein
MTYQEIVTEIEKLPLSEQLSLLEVLLNLIKYKTPQRGQQADSLKRVRGLLKPAPGDPVPTEAELTNDYTNYLIEKYS